MENAYDWLYVLMNDGREYLIDRCLAQRSYNPREEDLLGGMAERTNALVLKTRGGETPVGSNPTSPAYPPDALASDPNRPNIKSIKNC